MRIIYLALVLLTIGSMATAIPVGVSNTIPAGYHIIDTTSFDLNKDNFTDYALAIENDEGKKQLLVLLSERDGTSFNKALQDSAILLNLNDTAYNSGFFKKISFTDTLLTIGFIVLQHDTIVLQYGFSFTNRKWLLTRFQSEKYSQSNTSSYLRNDCFSVNFAIGEGASWYETGPVRNKGGPIDHYLPFACDVKPLVDISTFKPMSSTDPVLSLSGFRLSGQTKKLLNNKKGKIGSDK